MRSGKLHLLTDSEIFGWERPQPRQRPPAQARSRRKPDYADSSRAIRWCMSITASAAIEGLVRRMLEGAEREFLASNTTAATSFSCRCTRPTV